MCSFSFFLLFWFSFFVIFLLLLQLVASSTSAVPVSAAHTSATIVIFPSVDLPSHSFHICIWFSMADHGSCSDCSSILCLACVDCIHCWVAKPPAHSLSFKWRHSWLLLFSLPLSLSISISIYLHIYICCEVKILANFYPFSKSIFWPSQSQYFGQGHFRTIKIGVSGVFLAQLSSCVFFLFPIIWQFSKNSLFQKKGAKIGFFNFLCFKFKFWKFSFFRSAKTL